MDKDYTQLMREKKRFIVFTLSFAFLFYFMLPITLIFFPGAMNQSSFITGITWAWLYAFFQILMIWILGFFYHLKAKKIDRILENMAQEEES